MRQKLIILLFLVFMSVKIKSIAPVRNPQLDMFRFLSFFEYSDPKRLFDPLSKALAISTAWIISPSWAIGRSKLNLKQKNSDKKSAKNKAHNQNNRTKSGGVRKVGRGG